MDIQDFISAFAEQFDETDISEISMETVFQELEEWSSLTNASPPLDIALKITCLTFVFFIAKAIFLTSCFLYNSRQSTVCLKSSLVALLTPSHSPLYNTI